MTTADELMAWVQAQRKCPICREEECDCWQALTAVPTMLAALKSIQKWLLDTRVLAEGGAMHPLFVKANNLVIKAIAQATGREETDAQL